ncbi:OmpA family protein [Methylomonas fluvii]|uniref:OmpA family protein n=1 Tax=Methylomonas fluvii TaxID=1854564 RepID=A0ABR9DJR9_9GAMM|nr:OmpA family protein [Methylomonas fluvii]MBD9363345.1 OmpA family protein [Methylomonas fluvii]
MSGKKAAYWLIFLAGVLIVIGQIILTNYSGRLQFFGQLFIAYAIVCGWYVLVFHCRSRFFIAIVGILVLSAWLFNKVFESINHLALTKESAFIIAVAIFAWLAMSCYVLGLLKDCLSEGDEKANDGTEYCFANHGAEPTTRNRTQFFIFLAIVFSILGVYACLIAPFKQCPLANGDGHSGNNQGASFTTPGVYPASKPIEAVPKISGLPSEPVSPPHASTPPLVNSGFLGILADMALNAIKAAESKESDASSLPSVAATEFIKGFSSEAGKAPVSLFSDLIKAGFGKNTDKDISKERAEISSAILRVLINDNPSLAPPIFLSCPENKTTARPPLSEQILFDTNESKLSRSADHTIDIIRTIAQAHPTSILLLSSNTDTTGSAARNRTLTKQRTDVVRERLISYGGIEPSRIFSSDLATQSLPVITAPNMSEPLNRSVIIKVRD